MMLFRLVLAIEVSPLLTRYSISMCIGSLISCCRRTLKAAYASKSVRVSSFSTVVKALLAATVQFSTHVWAC